MREEDKYLNYHISKTLLGRRKGEKYCFCCTSTQLLNLFNTEMNEIIENDVLGYIVEVEVVKIKKNSEKNKLLSNISNQGLPMNESHPFNILKTEHMNNSEYEKLPDQTNSTNNAMNNDNLNLCPSTEDKFIHPSYDSGNNLTSNALSSSSVTPPSSSIEIDTSDGSIVSTEDTVGSSSLSEISPSHNLSLTARMAELSRRTGGLGGGTLAAVTSTNIEPLGKTPTVSLLRENIPDFSVGQESRIFVESGTVINNVGQDQLSEHNQNTVAVSESVSESKIVEHPDAELQPAEHQKMQDNAHADDGAKVNQTFLPQMNYDSSSVSSSIPPTTCMLDIDRSNLPLDGSNRLLLLEKKYEDLKNTVLLLQERFDNFSRKNQDNSSNDINEATVDESQLTENNNVENNVHHNNIINIVSHIDGNLTTLPHAANEIYKNSPTEENYENNNEISDMLQINLVTALKTEIKDQQKEVVSNQMKQELDLKDIYRNFAQEIYEEVCLAFPSYNVQNDIVPEEDNEVKLHSDREIVAIIRMILKNISNRHTL